MKYFLDTNILLRLMHQSDPQHAMVRASVQALEMQGATFCFASQNGIETWNVSTRPANKNGYGMTPPEAKTAVTTLAATFEHLPDSPLVYPGWLRLVQVHGVPGCRCMTRGWWRFALRTASRIS